MPILVAALREGMLNLAGREGDGAIVNWLSADDVATVAPIVKAHGPDKEIVARIFVVPSEDTETVRAPGPLRGRGLPQRARLRGVPRVARTGRAPSPTCGGCGGPATGPRRSRPSPTRSSTTSSSTAPPSSAGPTSQRYVDNGVTTPVLAVLPLAGVDVAAAVRELAPRG